MPNRTDLLELPTVELASLLLGTKLICMDPAPLTSGLIVECEAYLGVADRACHAYGGRKTPRLEPLWSLPGHAYVYCIHTHWLLNVTTRAKGIPECILIRALFPLDGTAAMAIRRGTQSTELLTTGPGRLCQAMGIARLHSGVDLFAPESSLRLERASDHELCAAGITVKSVVKRGPRIGVKYAGEDASLPLRFRIG